MQVRTNPDIYYDARILVVTSLANLRQVPPPSAVGNTLATQQYYSIAIVLGSASAFGGNPGIYAWDAQSALADNNSTVIKPDSPQVGGNPGRWRILGGTL
jgi:hypothetical protein